jgi:transposase
VASPRLAAHQKKARRRGAEIAFVDETGFSFRDGVATTWAPRGRPPVLRRKSARRAISTAVALTLSGRVLWRHFDRSVRGVEARAFLRYLRRCVRGPLTVIWDGLSAHRSPEVKRYLAEHPEVEIEALPPYAPELNPEEFCHGNVKQRMRNTLPETPSAIRRQADRGFTRLRRRRDLLLGFFYHAGLRVRRLT